MANGDGEGEGGTVGSERAGSLAPAAGSVVTGGPRAAAAVEVEALTVRFGELVAVRCVSFQADYGEVTAILGPNGAGKTTTVEALEGFRRPASGRLRVAGLDPIDDERALWRTVGVVLQRGGVYPMMSAGRALRLFASYYDDPRPPAELLSELGLESVGSTPFKRLSGGEQQRLALALALVGRPRVVFLDEPTAGVDPAGRIAVREVISRLREDGVCVVLTSHELEEVERLADRVVMLRRGTVVASGRPAELTGPAETIRFVTAPHIDVADLGRELGAPVTEGSAGHYVATIAPSPAAVSALTSWLARRDLVLLELDAGGESLEELFLRLAKDEA